MLGPSIVFGAGAVAGVAQLVEQCFCKALVAGSSPVTGFGGTVEMNHIGRGIAIARRRRTMTQEDLEIEIGVARGTVSKYESGRITPSWDSLTRIAQALGYSIGQLEMWAKDGDK